MKFILPLLIVPALAFANSHGTNYDIIERTLNFLLFFGILIYFATKPLRQMYLDRINRIANKLENIQEKLKVSKSKRDEAIKKVEEAKINALNLVETAQKEAQNLAQKVKKDSEQEILNIEKGFKDQKEFEERKMTKIVVNEILSEIFDNNNLKIDQKELVNIILKKVS